MLATRSGAPPRRWQHARGLRLDVGNMLGGCALQPDASNARGLRLNANLSIHYFYTRCWQHARGLRLELVSIHLGIGDTLRAAPRIAFYIIDGAPSAASTSV
jgi:hypothetical protein